MVWDTQHIFAICMIAAYFLPALTAFGRRHTHPFAVLVLNVIVGAGGALTLWLWVIVFLWAALGAHRVRSPSAQSGPAL